MNGVDDSTDRLVRHTGASGRFLVRVISGPDVMCPPVVGEAELSIGVADDNDLCLTDTTVSRHHCVLRTSREGTYVTDLGSTNGTSVAGCRVDKALLSHGTRLSIGSTVLLFETIRDAECPLDSAFDTVVGSSPAIRRLCAIAARIAATDATVLLEGETGTGKGVIATAIHNASPRRDRPFVVVDCGAVSATLIESELFGHARGAFTGADTDRAGLFEAADGGTVFLDEVGELPKELQSRLLRAIERREVRRVGSEVRRHVDVRVIAATNRNLGARVARGAFRSDLWYRLNPFRLEVPPLRERPEDIPLLASRFYAELVGEPGARLPSTAIEAMMRHEWPGNVRELRSAVERWVILGNAQDGHRGHDWIDEVVHDIRPEPNLSFRNAKQRATNRWESRYLSQLLKNSGGNLSKAARAANMDRGYLRELLRRHEISTKTVHRAQEQNAVISG